MTVRETSPACPALPVQPLAWSRTFLATPMQVREARQFLTRVLDGRPAANDAALCLGEVAANATIHSRSRDGGHFTVRVQIYGGRLRVEVQDEGGSWSRPVRRRDRQHGRGLLIVAALAHDWGRAGDSETGWRVWFEMDCP
jgi:anti-sigma regulatory factor (Ser/Thr protein kinase)